MGREGSEKKITREPIRRSSHVAAAAAGRETPTPSSGTSSPHRSPPLEAAALFVHASRNAKPNSSIATPLLPGSASTQ
jgi:hypothetical protein